jgi:hypothetical protein
MSTMHTKELNDLFESAPPFSERSFYVAPELFILIDGYMITSLGNQSKTYDDIVAVMTKFFSAHRIQAKFIPPIGGRGGAGGGLLAFIMEHAELLLALIRTVPAALNLAKKIKNYYEKRSVISQQKLLKQHKVAIPVTIYAKTDKQHKYEGSTNNRKIAFQLLLYVKEMQTLLESAFPAFEFMYTLETSVDESDGSVTISIRGDEMNDTSIVKIFKKIDRQYVDDDTVASFTLRKKKELFNLS